jgi:hypothetical protein
MVTYIIYTTGFTYMFFSLQTFVVIPNSLAACDSVAVKALRYIPEGRGLDTQWGDFLNLPNPSGRIGPGVYSASNRNEYQKHKNNNVCEE